MRHLASHLFHDLGVNNIKNFVFVTSTMHSLTFYSIGNFESHILREGSNVCVTPKEIILQDKYKEPSIVSMSHFSIQACSFQSSLLFKIVLMF